MAPPSLTDVWRRMTYLMVPVCHICIVCAADVACAELECRVRPSTGCCRDRDTTNHNSSIFLRSYKSPVLVTPTDSEHQGVGRAVGLSSLPCKPCEQSAAQYRLRTNCDDKSGGDRAAPLHFCLSDFKVNGTKRAWWRLYPSMYSDRTRFHRSCPHFPSGLPRPIHNVT